MTCRKLPRNVDSLKVELSGTITREGGSNEAITVYGTADSRDIERGRRLGLIGMPSRRRKIRIRLLP